MKPRLTIITASFPLTNQETYLADEIYVLKRFFLLDIFPLSSKGNFKLRLIDKSCHRPSFFGRLKGLVKNLPKTIETSIFIIKNSRGRRLVRNFRYMPRLMDIYCYLKENRTGHIHAYWASSPAFVALMLSRWLNVEYSFTMHRYDVEENDFLYQKILKAKFVRAVSSWTKETALKQDSRIAKISSKIKINRLSIKIPMFRKPSKIDKLRIVVPADYTENKGHIYLIRACSVLKDKMDFKVDFFGQGKNKTKIIKQIKELGLQEKIHVYDRISHKELLNKYLLDEYNLLILPSLKEALPMSVAEACAYSIAVIATNTGGTSEIFKDDRWIIRSGDYKHLAKKIIEFSKLNSIEKLAADNYKQVNKEFDEEKCTKQLIKLIKK